MSLLSDKVYALLKEVFPHIKVKKEYFVVYNGQRLFVDFFIPAFAMAIEVHGQQHDKFVQHFHGDAQGWRDHRKRDKIKEEWAGINGITFVVIHERDLPDSKEGLIAIIRESIRD